MTRPILIPALFLAIAANAAVAGQPASDATTHERDVNTTGTGPQRLAVDGGLLAVASPFREPTVSNGASSMERTAVPRAVTASG